MEKKNTEEIKGMLKVALEENTAYAVLGIIELIKIVILKDFSKNFINKKWKK